MKFLALLVLLGVSTILVSCQDAGTDTADTSESADGTTDSGTQADATDGQQDAESSDGTNDGTEGTSDSGDGDAAADQDQEDSALLALAKKLKEKFTLG
ncbi:mucin-like protein 2 [Rattus rattus]|uniref:mucin-like protein 2 n=1 Tax=Rattus rattus TaxID=10117 RepID=UPI0013F37EC7|nr:mucin-like protein 2 [Rattus rattus]